ISPLDVDNLLDLIDPCKPSTTTFEMGFSIINISVPSSGRSQVPCVVLGAIVIFAAAQNNSDKKSPGACSSYTTTTSHEDLCAFNSGGKFVEAFFCDEAGPHASDCCLDREKPFDHACEHRGKPGEYGVEAVHGLQLWEA